MFFISLTVRELANQLEAPIDGLPCPTNHNSCATPAKRNANSADAKLVTNSETGIREHFFGAASAASAPAFPNLQPANSDNELIGQTGEQTSGRAAAQLRRRRMHTSSLGQKYLGPADKREAAAAIVRVTEPQESPTKEEQVLSLVEATMEYSTQDAMQIVAGELDPKWFPPVVS